MTQSRKRESKRNFDKKYLWQLEQMFDIEFRDNGSYTFEVEGYGIVDYYPGSNKLLIREDNEWVPNGQKWIIKKILE